MNLCLDTHILLWWLDDNPALSEIGRSVISDVNNVLVISAVVIWEIRIKQSIGKLEITPDFYKIIKTQGFELLPIHPNHAYAVGDLPYHHRDPFDRMIIAQAKHEGLRVVTHDSIFKKYDIALLEI